MGLIETLEFNNQELFSNTFVYSVSANLIQQDYFLDSWSPGHFTRFLWSCYSVVNSPGVNAPRNTLETDLTPITQTTSGGDLGCIQMKLDKCKCIWLLKPHMQILLLPH